MKTRPALEWAALAALAAAVIGLDLWWIRHDTAPMAPTDPYEFLIRLLHVVDGVRAEGLGNPLARMDQLSFAGRPPLYQLLTVPFVLLFGRSEDAALGVNLLFFALLLTATFAGARMLRDARAGLLAAALVAGYPPVLHLSRIYRPYFAVIACIALSLWLLLLLVRTRSVRVAWGFGLSLGFGMLIHSNFVFVMALPTLVFGFYLLLFQTAPRYPAGARALPVWLGRKLRDRFALLGLGGGAFLALVAVVPWYATRGLELLKQLFRISSSEIASYRGFTIQTVGFHDVEASFWWYARTAPGAISNVLAILAVAGLIAALWRRRPLELVPAVAFAGGYLVLNLLPVRMWAYGVFLLPATAILSAVWLTGLRPRPLRLTAVTVTVATLVVTFALTIRETPAAVTRVAGVLGARLHQTPAECQRVQAFCPTPPVAEAWPVAELFEHVYRDPRCGREPSCRLMVAVRGSGLRRQYLEYVQVRDRVPQPLRITNTRIRLWGAPYPFRDLLESDYLLVSPPRREPRTPLAGNYMAATERFLAAPPPVFARSHHEVAKLVMPGGRHVRLLRRVAPLTLEEAEETVAAVPLEEKFKRQRFELLARLRREAGDLDGAEAELRAAPAVSGRTAHRRRAWQWRALGKAYQRAERPEDAIRALERAVELVPGLAGHRLELARALAAAGRVDDALAQLDAARRLAPGDGRIEHLWTRLRGRAGRAPARP